MTLESALALETNLERGRGGDESDGGAPPPEDEEEADFRVPRASGRWVYSASEATNSHQFARLTLMPVEGLQSWTSEPE